MTGKGALQGCQDVGRCPALGAWLLCQRTRVGHTPSHGHNVPLSLPADRGWEVAARPCSLWEWLWCDTLSPPWPLLVHKPELWQGQTCVLGCALSSLLQGLTPHSQLRMWPPKGRLRRPGAPQLPERTMAHPCPGPSPRDNNGRSRSRSRLSSSPPESLEGAGAGGGLWAVRQRLPPSPALCLARAAPLPPSHLHPPQGTLGGRDTAAAFWGIQRAPPWLLPTPGTASSRVGSPHCRLAARSPLQLLCASVCQGIVCEGETRRGSSRSRASPQHPPCVRWPRRKQLLPRGTRGIVPRSWCPPARFSLALKTLWG